jgi:ribonuclease BN (tRNA processing enzyme)
MVLLAYCSLAGPLAHADATDACPPAKGVAVQILGSGGPIADDDRASSAYLVWVDGESRALIDAGGGAFLRFGEAGASFSSLDFIGLSHFHTDHSADFPALLKSGYFSNRRRSLIVVGPDAGGPFPGLDDFLASMLAKDGAYGYLSGYLDGTGGLANIAPFEINKDIVGAVTVLGDTSAYIQIDAMHVPHGIVPALAYRVRIGDAIIVFSGDQNGSNDNFVEFAKNAAVLIAHMPVPEGIRGAGRSLHAAPGVIGTIAGKARVGTLVLSHLMARSLRNLDDNVAIVKSHYNGPVMVANDLDCVIIESKEATWK